MSPRQTVGSRPTAGGLLLVRAAAAMSLLCRFRAYNHQSNARPITALHGHLSGMMAACPGGGTSSVQSTSSPCTATGGRVGVTTSMAAFASSAAAARTRLTKSVGGISRVRARADGSSALRGSSVGGYSRVDGRGGLGQIQQTSRRRRRTSLGMVSDQPFRGPQAAPMEAMRFQELGLLPELVDSMDDFGFESPSKIQRKAVPQILNGGNIVLAAETGSGKTLAYLLPLIQQLKAQEMQQTLGEADPIRRTQRPRALVLVPTRELAVQVLEVAKRVSRTCKFSSCGVIGGEEYGKQKRQLAGTVDVVVASPGRLLKHQEQGNFFMSQVTHIVIDEVDTMLTQGFGADIEKLTRPILSNPARVDKSQFILVTATLTRAVRKLLDEGNFPKVRMLETRDVHHSLPSLKHIMIDIKGRDKMSALVDVVQQYHKEFKRTLVFCNTVKSCRAAEFGLREVDVPTLSYHGEVPSDERTSNLERFKAGDVDYLVCTDIAARGLDMPDVEHVVMFDFPLNPIDYLHRSGRTARMGASGMVTSLLAKRDIVLAAAIERAVQAGMPLDELSSRRTDYASGAKLGPVFGRKGVVKNKGNNHALKATINIRARGGVSSTGERLGAPRKTQKAGAAAAAAGGRRSGGAAWGRGTSRGKSGPGRARQYN